MMAVTVEVWCDVCESLISRPFESEPYEGETTVGDEHESSGLVLVKNYEGSGTVWMCRGCHREHLEDMAFWNEED